MTSRQKRQVHSCTCDNCQQHPRGAFAKEHRAINRVLANLNEKNRRRFAGVLAMQWGRGGVRRVIEITGLSRNTICRGRDEVQRGEGVNHRDRVRQRGGGRRSAEKSIQAS